MVQVYLGGAVVVEAMVKRRRWAGEEMKMMVVMGGLRAVRMVVSGTLRLILYPKGLMAPAAFLNRLSQSAQPGERGIPHFVLLLLYCCCSAS